RRSLVAVDALAPFVALLRLDRQRGDRAGFEPAQRDRLAGFLAIAVGALVDAGERRVDLGDQLALAGARPELGRAIGLRGGAVGEVGMILVLVLQVLQSLACLPENVLLPDEQLVAEILAMALIHEGFFVGRSVVFFL